MSIIIQNQFLKTQLDSAIELYNNQVVPKLTKRNKVIAIGTAITLSLIALFHEKVLKPPKKLRHIPHVSFFNIFKVLIRGETYWERAYRTQLPLLDSPESKGLYLVCTICAVNCIGTRTSVLKKTVNKNRNTEELDGSYLSTTLKISSEYYLKQVRTI
jgi:hypothetical protein